MIEASFGRPARDIGTAEIGEAFLEAGDDFPGARVARGNRAASAGIAALKIHFANAEAHGTAFLFSEELVFPERWHAIDFECRAEAAAHLVDIHPIKQFAAGLQRRRGNDRRAVGDGVVRETFGRVADGDGLLEEAGKPSGCGSHIAWEGKCFSGDFAAITWNRECDRTSVRRIRSADQVYGCGALAVYPLAIRGIERPGAVEFEAAARTDARLLHVNRVE